MTVRFYGQVFHPQTPIDLEPNTDYEITIRPKSRDDKSGTACELRKEMKGTVEAPEDWPEKHGKSIRPTALDILDRYAGSVEGSGDMSIEHNRYLYGTLKRGSSEDA